MTKLRAQDDRHNSNRLVVTFTAGYQQDEDGLFCEVRAKCPARCGRSVLGSLVILLKCYLQSGRTPYQEHSSLVLWYVTIAIVPVQQASGFTSLLLSEGTTTHLMRSFFGTI